MGRLPDRQHNRHGLVIQEKISALVSDEYFFYDRQLLWYLELPDPDNLTANKKTDLAGRFF